MDARRPCEKGSIDMETRLTYRTGKINLPSVVADATVIVDQNSDTEVPLYEEAAATLSDRDRDRFLDLLDTPPKANPALRRAAERHARRPHADWRSERLETVQAVNEGLASVTRGEGRPMDVVFDALASDLRPAISGP